jgi:hypothetical protein
MSEALLHVVVMDNMYRILSGNLQGSEGSEDLALDGCMY